MALYVTVMYFTSSFSFGQYQIRIATALYSLNFLCPFLIIPLGLANSLSNTLLGGLGLFDTAGGFLVGIVTGGGVYIIRRFKLPALLIIPVIIFAPGLIVPIWLSGIISVPYLPLAISLCIGQTAPAVVGYFLVKVLEKYGMKIIEGQR